MCTCPELLFHMRFHGHPVRFTMVVTCTDDGDHHKLCNFVHLRVVHMGLTKSSLFMSFVVIWLSSC
jgi:hypothetical protein